jgi:phage-related protein
MKEKEVKYRQIYFYKDYFEKFFIKQNDKVKNKIIWTLQLLEDLQYVPEKYLKHIESSEGIFEIRVQVGNNIFRIFCFFDEGNLVIIENAYQKKTQKTNVLEIKKAIKIKKEYFDEKG